MRSTLLLFAKHWTPGGCKSRLAAVWGDAAAAALQRLFVQATVRRFAHSGTRRTLAYTPDDKRTDFAAVVGDAWQLAPQTTGDLGQRLSAQFAAAVAEGSDCVLAIGADSPDLPVARIEAAIEQLRNVEAVLGPATDGGYYLLGLRPPLPIIWDVPWGTPQVLSATIAQLREQQRTFHLLPEWADVDHPADLSALLVRCRTRPDDLQLQALADAIEACRLPGPGGLPCRP